MMHTVEFVLPVVVSGVESVGASDVADWVNVGFAWVFWDDRVVTTRATIAAAAIIATDTRAIVVLPAAVLRGMVERRCSKAPVHD
jgi:hypothetical protein